MNKKRICIVCVIIIFVIMTGYFFKKKSEKEISMEPDVVSSISMNRDQYESGSVSYSSCKSESDRR